MKSNEISQNIAEFQATQNPLYLANAIYLLISQGRLYELIYGIYGYMFYRPLVVKAHPNLKLQDVIENLKLLLSTKDFLCRDNLIAVFGEDYAVRYLPENFCGARMEAIVCDQDFLVIGEYGHPGKRIALVNQQSCVINEFYNEDPSVMHIHAVYKSRYSRDVLVTTGDKAKYLDLWDLQNNIIIFNKRLKKSLAGHTAILNVRGEYYFGTDFSNRPNYIESMDGRKFFFPEKANKMYVNRFMKCEDRYIVSLNKEMICFGGRYTLSIFDVEQKEFVYCDYQDYIESEMAHNALQRTAIMLRSHTAGEL